MKLNPGYRTITGTQNKPRWIVAFCLVVSFGIGSGPALAISLKYVYRGSNFDQFEGTPGIFSPADRVTAAFTIDCGVAHTEGDCRNLPYDDYFELGAIEMESIRFSAGPAMLPSSDGSVIISRFLFSTDGLADIKDWDVVLVSDEPFQNIDTDNVGGGVDSAAALGGYANINNQPGVWGRELLPDESDLDLEIEKAVDRDHIQDLGQPLEFTVSVVNRGPGQANDVVVVDLLPPELEIPEGLAAYTSTGYYDPLSGRWEVGDLDTTLPEIMKLPAVVIKEPGTSCVVNTATIDTPGDLRAVNNQAISVVRLPGSKRCVDLSVEAIPLGWPYIQQCPDKRFKIRYRFTLRNSAADPARNVVLKVSQSDYQATAVTSETPNCDGPVCKWDVLTGEVIVNFETDYISVGTAITHGLTAVVSSKAEDYTPENNQVTHRVEVSSSFANCETPPAPGWNFNIGGAAGGCFIATAVYGSDSHPHVQTLRKFRDNFLMRTDVGRKLVNYYYRYSPKIARVIAERDFMRLLFRGFLAPIVFFIAYPWLAAVGFVLLVICLYRVSRRAREKSAVG